MNPIGQICWYKKKGCKIDILYQNLVPKMEKIETFLYFFSIQMGLTLCPTGFCYNGIGVTKKKYFHKSKYFFGAAHP